MCVCVCQFASAMGVQTYVFICISVTIYLYLRTHWLQKLVCGYDQQAKINYSSSQIFHILTHT